MGWEVELQTIPISAALLLLVSFYCAAQAFLDYRRRNFLMAALGAACMVVIWTVPIHTHAVKVDLPVDEGR